jgi:hypothetical protein
LFQKRVPEVGRGRTPEKIYQLLYGQQYQSVENNSYDSTYIILLAVT